jgi:hypothetical protein
MTGPHPQPFVRVQVETYSGYKADERPVAFVHENRRHEIADILDRWYEGGRSPKDQNLDYYKVRTTDGSIHILRHNPLFESWSLLVTNPDL